MSDPFLICGRRILVIGSASCIGAAIVHALQAEGAVITEWSGSCGQVIEPLDGAVVVVAPPDRDLPATEPQDDDLEAQQFDAMLSEPVTCLLKVRRDGLLRCGSSIVTVLSTASVRHAGAHPVHAAAEAALNAFLRTLVLDCTEERLRFNSVVHGRGVLPVRQQEPTDDSVILPSISEIAGTVLFFLSDASRWISRSRLILDGGATLKTSLVA